MKNKKWLWLAGLPTAAIAGSYLISEHLFKIGMGHRIKEPHPSKTLLPYAKEYYEYLDWYNRINKETWYNYEPSTEETMVADFIPNEKKTDKVVIIAHGYNGNRSTMSGYAKMFYDMGFNILMPDDRGHGQSAGKYISFGWLDQKDYISWINKILKQYNDNCRILLFGVSMGAGIVSMLSGNKLPKQVKAIIADCGYSSVQEELSYLLKNQFHLPYYPFEPMVSSLNKRRLGYHLNDASTVEQLKKNHLPIFFIHGGLDTYVPTYMAYDNYRATKAAKQLWIVNNAHHAESFWLKPKEYRKRVSEFLATYFNN